MTHAMEVSSVTLQELRALRIHRQHLTAPVEALTVVRDLCGLQCQFLSCALHALRIRTGQPFSPEGLVKNWTLRGTVHLFAESDLPLFLSHDGRQTIAEDGFHHWRTGALLIAPERYRRFCETVLAQVAQGNDTRAGLKEACAAEGMTEKEADAFFDPWGGGLRDLCQRGLLNHRLQEKKAFMPCPPFTPLPEDDARQELLRRYLFHAGPATLRDASYFFAWPQTELRQRMERLGAREVQVDGGRCFFLGDLPGEVPDAPACVLLAGFDQLLLSYQKLDGVFLDAEHLRGIFSLAGIVHPAMLLRGQVAGRWQRKGSRVTFQPFRVLSPQEKRSVTEAMERSMDDVKRVAWD